MLEAIPLCEKATQDIKNLFISAASQIELLKAATACDMARYQDGVSQAQSALFEAARDGVKTLANLVLLGTRHNCPATSIETGVGRWWMC